MPRRGEKYWVHSQDVVPEQEVPRRRPSGGKPCPGPCNHRWRKAQEALDAHQAAVELWEKYPIGDPPTEPEVPTASPWPGEPVFCMRCSAVMRRELHELDYLASIRIAESDGHRRGPAGERVGGSRGTPSPGPATDDVDELSLMLRGWESIGRGQDDTPPRRGWLAREITTSVAWLVAHFDELIMNPDIAVDFAIEIRQWHRRLREAEKAGTGRHHLPVPCRRCGQKSLEAVDGEEYVECVNMNFGDHGGRCGLLLSRQEYEGEASAWLATRGKPMHPPAA